MNFDFCKKCFKNNKENIHHIYLEDRNDFIFLQISNNDKNLSPCVCNVEIYLQTDLIQKILMFPEFEKHGKYTRNALFHACLFIKNKSLIKKIFHIIDIENCNCPYKLEHQLNEWNKNEY